MGPTQQSTPIALINHKQSCQISYNDLMPDLINAGFLLLPLHKSHIKWTLFITLISGPVLDQDKHCKILSSLMNLDVFYLCVCGPCGHSVKKLTVTRTWWWTLKQNTYVVFHLSYWIAMLPTVSVCEFFTRNSLAKKYFFK